LEKAVDCALVVNTVKRNAFLDDDEKRLHRFLESFWKQKGTVGVVVVVT
jgi:hypothetical protein